MQWANVSQATSVAKAVALSEWDNTPHPGSWNWVSPLQCGARASEAQGGLS